ncbi:secondary thiamine-phosphate synthase enzyme YjbQ [Thalassotalea crassostreae]|uniref:secondary thiamine-phosphate synthase enzyme YjbQ n=1 Tax=Thalassotalea crassostreae TaxID=1763536 RepID=UPI000837DBD3|nr:secondary thiamine-phosphate synthase enzyme YjbQ [Thalassotalea crassostreae]
MWLQTQFNIPAKSRGFHLITDQVINNIPQLKNIEVGILHLFLQHTSASLTINENADPTVRADLEQHFNHFVPENQSYYQHDYEGSDDMPAHIKSSINGCQLTIPITNGQLALGTWQGIYLGEHRNHGGSRRVIATLNGQNN